MMQTKLGQKPWVVHFQPKSFLFFPFFFLFLHFFFFPHLLFETGFLDLVLYETNSVDQVDLELRDPPASYSITGIKGVCHSNLEEYYNCLRFGGFLEIY